MESIQVCQNRACKKQGAAKVLAAFEANLVPGVTVTGRSCLGQCGNGPMVLILPEMVRYSKVYPSKVKQVIERHLLNSKKFTQVLHH
ncbi:MAG: (2Fe-2S) ferredoxin domain-containing protein [Cyanobacteria bacterium J06635_10]